MITDNKLNIVFISEDHRQMFYATCKTFGFEAAHDPYHLAAAYLMTLDRVTRTHIDDIFDFNGDAIKPEGLNKDWQTSTSLKTTRLLFNLWNGYNANGEPLEEEKPSAYCTPENIFCCSYAPYYWQAIKLRYPEYTKPD